jgi:hypothetical protein
MPSKPLDVYASSCFFMFLHSAVPSHLLPQDMKGTLRTFQRSVPCHRWWEDWEGALQNSHQFSHKPMWKMLHLETKVVKNETYGSIKLRGSLAPIYTEKQTELISSATSATNFLIRPLRIGHASRGRQIICFTDFTFTYADLYGSIRYIHDLIHMKNIEKQ